LKGAFTPDSTEGRPHPSAFFVLQKGNAIKFGEQVVARKTGRGTPLNKKSGSKRPFKGKEGREGGGRAGDL